MLCKGALLLSKWRGQGTTLGGKLGFALDRNLLKKLLRGVHKEVILILGSTGKTTTRNILLEIFNKEGFDTTVNNHRRKDAYGILGALLEKANFFKGLQTDYVLLEINDLKTLALLKDLKPGHIILTNIFKEQVSRKVSLELTVRELEEALKTVPQANLILNGDDPVVVGLGAKLENPKIYYGIDMEVDEQEDDEVFYCPACGQELDYQSRRYSQLGTWSCPSCAFDNPALDYQARNVTLKDGIYFDFVSSGEEYPFDLPGVGIYNIYNILGALALVEELDLGVEAAELALEKMEFQDLELDTFYINKPIFLNDAETEALFLHSLEIIDEDDEGILDLLLFFNTLGEEEENTFIWNLPLGVLGKSNIRSINITGDRAYDLALALRYQGISQNKIFIWEDVEEGLNQSLSGKGDKLYIVSRGEAPERLSRKLKGREKKWSLG